MASLYAPQLTRWRVETGGGGVVRDCVEHEGKQLLVRRQDCRRRVFFRNGDNDVDDTQQRCECVQIGGEVFPLMDEKTVPVPGGKAAVRCVEYVEDDGSALLLTVTVTEGEGKEEKQQQVAEVDARDGEVRVLGCGGSYYDPDTGTVQHVVDVPVQGGRESYMLLVSVRKELARIVRVKRLN